MLDNFKVYYVYADLVKNGKFVINTNTITIDNWHDHYNGILNILRDGIETEYVKHLFITVNFNDQEVVELLIGDYYLNLLLWYPIIALRDDYIQPKHLFVSDRLRRKDIKGFIDNHFLIPRKLKVDNKVLNNVIADTIEHFIDINEFAMYLSNTLNLEDSIDLMSVNQEYYDLLHADLSNETLDNVKDKGLELVNKAESIIFKSEELVGHEHCLRNALASGEGININQYKDHSINIGTKPDGQGSVHHEIINKSYITGGLDNLLSQYIDSASARVAQIISKKNVGDSGGFARILKLNNIGTYLYPDPNFDCGTNNYLKITITDYDIFKLLLNRYYKTSNDAPLLKITKRDTHLIGKTILVRSPMFCDSHAHGHGICYKCYGDLAYTNYDISVGCIAAEILTEQYTQSKLGAKHLLEAKIKALLWNDNFENWFELDINNIILKNDLDLDLFRDWKLRINLDNIMADKESDFYKYDYNSDNFDEINLFYNEYLENFDIIDPEGNIYSINGSINDKIDEEFHNIKMYLTSGIRNLIRNNISIDDENNEVYIDLNDLENTSLFKIKMENNDLNKLLDVFDDLINKKDVTKQYSADELIYKLLSTTIKSNIVADSIHLEVLISNQIRSINDKLMMPNWININEPYELLTLDEALSYNPSPMLSLTYRKLSRMLISPFNFNKFAPSVYDLFFIRKPKKMLNIDHEILDIPYEERDKNNPVSPVIQVRNPKGEHPKNIKKILKDLGIYHETSLND